MVSWLSRVNTIEEIKERFRKYPDVRYEADDSRITIYPRDTDGFPVSLTVLSEGYTVAARRLARGLHFRG